MAERKKVKHYVNKKDLYEDLKGYWEARQRGENPQISNYVGQCILKICNGLALRPNFNGYSYKDEMVSEAYVQCVAAVRVFNPNRSDNPFGFLTRTAWNAFIRYIKEEKKQNYIKHKNHQRLHILEGENIQNDVSDIIIESFETSMVVAAAKVPKKK